MNGTFFTSFDCAKIFYEVSRQKGNRWAIFLHGFGGDLTAWANERRYFHARGISTVALDLRGHGLSARSNKKTFYALENFARDIECLMNELHIEQAVIIGHCFGGMVSIIFSANYSQRVEALILIDTGSKMPIVGSNAVAKTLVRYLFGLFSQYGPNIHTTGHADFTKFVGTTDLDPKRILSDILHTSFRSYFSIFSMLTHYDLAETLGCIKAPTLVIGGSEDSIFPPHIAKFLSQRIKRSELNMIKGANHIVVLNNPEDLNKSMISFLQKIKLVSTSS